MGFDQKYALERFLRAGMGAEPARQLADELAEEVQARLHGVIMRELDDIVAELNALGHNLRSYTKPVPGDISFRDDDSSTGGYVCRLRLGVDTIVSTGFGDTRDGLDED